MHGLARGVCVCACACVCMYGYGIICEGVEGVRDRGPILRERANPDTGHAFPLIKARILIGGGGGGGVVEGQF